MEEDGSSNTIPRREQSIFHKDRHWHRGNKLGQGCFGSVHLALFPLHNRCDYFRDFPSMAAVKSACFSNASELYREKEVYEALGDCPFTVNCLGDDVTSSHTGHKMVFNLFLEYAAGGNLMDFVRDSKNSRLPEPQAKRFARSVLGGIERIHGQGFVHCDVRLENVLLFEEGGELVAKLADFGLAKRVAESQGRSDFLHGTTAYWAPEMVINGVQGQASDIWALGCLVLGMLTGELPWDEFGSLTDGEMEDLIATESPAIKCGVFSDEALSFVNQCFRSDPRKRPTATELLRHPFVAAEKKTRMAGRARNMLVGVVGWFKSTIDYVCQCHIWWCIKCVFYVVCMILMPNKAYTRSLKEH